jgi:hypothetical protein
MYKTSIKNLLNRFIVNPSMSKEDRETTIRDVLWNVKQIKDGRDK